MSKFKTAKAFDKWVVECPYCKRNITYAQLGPMQTTTCPHCNKAFYVTKPNPS